MKYLKSLLLVVLSTVFLIACSGNNTSVAAKDNEDSSSCGTASAGDAHFSCVIDGQPVQAVPLMNCNDIMSQA